MTQDARKLAPDAQEALRRRRALMTSIRSYLEKRRNDPRLVRRCFHEPSVRYAMAR